MQQILFMSADRRLAIFLADELAKIGGDDVRLTQDQMQSTWVPPARW